MKAVIEKLNNFWKEHGMQIVRNRGSLMLVECTENGEPVRYEVFRADNWTGTAKQSVECPSYIGQQLFTVKREDIKASDFAKTALAMFESISE